MSIIRTQEEAFTTQVQVLVVGAGACGMTAALAASEQGAEVLVLERDVKPTGSTSLSSGLIPAAGTRWQQEKGIEDHPKLFAEDIQQKAKGKADQDLVRLTTESSGPCLEWLADQHGIPFEILEGFLYPGHHRLRMHAVPEHTGSALLHRLYQSVQQRGIPVLCEATVSDLFVDEDQKVQGVRVLRPDGSLESIGCQALILACNGYGGNPEFLKRFIPELEGMNYFGHTGNQGDAVRWGEALGVELRDMSAYQGHGSVAHPHGVLITWALMMEGGIQVNLEANRFSNEHQGYSEQSVAVFNQSEHLAWNLYDARLHQLGMEFEDYRNAEQMGAVRTAPDLEKLSKITSLHHSSLEQTFQDLADFQQGKRPDPFGRDFTGKPLLEPPYYAVKVSCALFHTQGGLVVNPHAQVVLKEGESLPNLYAGGGAAQGVSGPAVWGYLSGNGLLTAITLGRLAGEHAAKQARQSQT